MGDQIIKNKLLYYKTKLAFEADKNKINLDSIVFIEGTKEVWTHGQFFTSGGGLPSNIIEIVNTAVNNKIQNLNEERSLIWNI